MQKILQSKIFLSFFIITFTIGLLISLNSFLSFQSQVNIVLVPKSITTAKNADKIQANTAEIITSLNFYDQILDSENISTELTLGRKPAERKSDWQKRITVKKSKNSNILSIFTYDSNRNKAQVLSQKVARNISDTMSRYYNIKTELEIRIIDGVVSEKNWISSSLIPWILSLIFAFISGLVAFLAFNSIELASKPNINIFSKNYFNKKKTIYIPEEEPYIFPNKEDFPEIIEEDIRENLELFPLEEIDLIKEDRKSVETKNTNSKKMSAPANLPIADSSSFSFKEEDTHSVDDSQEEVLEILEKAKSIEESGVHEATPKEVKERLNKLLKGKL